MAIVTYFISAGDCIMDLAWGNHQNLPKLSLIIGMYNWFLNETEKPTSNIMRVKKKTQKTLF